MPMYDPAEFNDGCTTMRTASFSIPTLNSAAPSRRRSTSSSETGSAYAVVQRFAQRGLRFPKRAYGGAWDGKVVWGNLTHSWVSGSTAGRGTPPCPGENICNCCSAIR
jgi:hypothetical protein